jgi:methionyl-tRNA formyltransferase
MDEGADSGDILSQVEVTIQKNDTAQDLYDKLIATAVEQVKNFSIALANGTASFNPQNHEAANYWRKRTATDGAVDFRMSSSAIYNLIRGLTKPYIGAHVQHEKMEYKVWASMIGPDAMRNYEPGKVLELIGEQFLVKTGDGSIWLTEHEIDTVLKPGDYFG